MAYHNWDAAILPMSFNILKIKSPTETNGKLEEVVWRILFEKKRGDFARNLAVVSPFVDVAKKKWLLKSWGGGKTISRNANSK